MDQGGPEHDSVRARDGEGVTPQLIPPALLNPVLPASIIAAAGLAFGLAYFGFPVTSPPSTAAKTPNTTDAIVISAGDFPGSITTVSKDLAIKAPYVLAAMDMPQPEKDRLKAAIANDTVRVGAITLWDNVAEDGDSVTLEGAGFAQHSVISHKPQIYFVPYYPGGTVEILGVRDGGGGITLGVKTALGDQYFPPLAEGQVMQVQIP